MNTKPFLCGMLLLLPLLAACSPQTHLVIRSDPPGATVYEGGEQWGVTPVSLDYTAATNAAATGCVATRPISVRWDSGAKARVSAINVCNGPKDTMSYTFVYPEGFPGEDELAAPGVAGQALRSVTADGQLYYDVSHPGSHGTLKCYSDLQGDQVITQCGG